MSDFASEDDELWNRISSDGEPGIPFSFIQSYS